MSTTTDRLTCPDDGTCHHECPSVAACFRVAFCGPLSGSFPGDRWPEGMEAAAAAARDEMPRRPIEDYLVGVPADPDARAGR